MKMGDEVQVYHHAEPQRVYPGIVIAVTDYSIAVEILNPERPLCARRYAPFARWIDIESGQPVEIV